MVAFSSATVHCSPSYLGGELTRHHREMFVVMYSKSDNTVNIDENQTSTTPCTPEESRRNKRQQHTEAASTNGGTTSKLSRPRSAYGQQRQLIATLSTTSTGSIRSRAPEFTDISIGADLLRFQREHQHALHQRGGTPTANRRSDPISLSSAIRNSLAMLLAYFTCSLPLVVMSVPQPAWEDSLTAMQRVQVLLLCRILFYLNAPAYPLWYLTYSSTVRKCFARLWEGYTSRHRGSASGMGGAGVSRT